LPSGLINLIIFAYGNIKKIKGEKEMKKVIALLLVAAMSISFVACGSKTSDKGTSNKGPFDIAACVYSEPHCIDPNVSDGDDQSYYLIHMYEGLMKYKETDQKSGDRDGVYLMSVDKGQAESYEASEDGLTYTFHLRDDIFWSDGQPVTAKDFVFSWQRLVDPQTASNNGSQFDFIIKNAHDIQQGKVDKTQLGVEATDDKTLVVHLENACPYFLDLCASSFALPVRQDIVEKYGNEWTEAKNVVCNGGYKMTEWVHDSYLKLVKNDKYYDYKNLGPDSITWYLSDNETSMLSAYKSGEYDFIAMMPADQVKPLKESGDLMINGKVGLYYLYLNVNQIADWRVRAAITLAIDRQNIVEGVTQGGEKIATGTVTAGITDSNGDLWIDKAGDVKYKWLQEKYPDFDLTNYEDCCELAKKLLAEAVAEGYDVNKTLDYQYNTSDTNKAIGEAIQSDVSSVLGINLTLNNTDSSSYCENLSHGGFSIARLGNSVSYDDPIGYLGFFGKEGSYNYSQWTDEKFDSLVMQAKTMPDGADRDNVMKQAEERMYQEGGFAVCPLYYYVSKTCLNKSIDNVGYVSLGFYSFMYAKQK
jgi:oligopeptide transport system substrate-binding protein